MTNNHMMEKTKDSKIPKEKEKQQEDQTAAEIVNNKHVTATVAEVIVFMLSYCPSRSPTYLKSGFQ
jgi:hypothetical protein